MHRSSFRVFYIFPSNFTLRVEMKKTYTDLLKMPTFHYDMFQDTSNLPIKEY